MERILTGTVNDDTLTNVEQVLRRQLGLTKRQISQAKFRDHGICKNGIPCRIHEALTPGDQVTVKIEEESDASSHLIPLKGDLKILYEDQDLILVEKRSGIPVHPAHGHYKDTLVNLLAYYFTQKDEHVLIRPVGRLDLETSGVVVFAKNQTAAARLDQQKKQGIFHKEYLAIVTGQPEQEQGEITSPIGRAPGSLNRMQVCMEGKTAQTYFWVEHYLKDQNRSLVRLRIKTGRTHQIRVHMASIGHPLLGDSCYNPHPELELIGRTALHAGTVWLNQPFTGEVLEIHSPIPEDMRNLIPHP